MTPNAPGRTERQPECTDANGNAAHAEHAPHVAQAKPATAKGTRTGLVLVSSTRAAQGIYTDESGPIAVEFLRAKGFDTPDATIVADKDITAVIDDIIADPDRPDVIVTSGGTGISPDDRVIESLQPHLDRELPGVAHAFWAAGLAKTPSAVLSRTLAGTIGQTFVMALPGSPGGVRDGVKILDEVLVHAVDVLKGHQVTNHGKHHS